MILFFVMSALLLSRNLWLKKVYVPQTGTIMRRTNDYLLGKKLPSLTFPLKKTSAKPGIRI